MVKSTEEVRWGEEQATFKLLNSLWDLALLGLLTCFYKVKIGIFTLSTGSFCDRNYF